MEVRKKKSIKHEYYLLIEMAKILLSDPFKVVRVFCGAKSICVKIILVRRFISGQKCVET
jgi:hypothetical protein